MNILDRIHQQKLADVARAKASVPFDVVREAALEASPARGFARAIRAGRGADEARTPQADLRVIAEVKKASPSVGVIRVDFDPVAIARSYELGGAAALSCLTDETFFQGSIDYLSQIRAAIKLPILRKDFILDAYQIWEARAAGADAILLIASFVGWDELRALREVAREAELDVLLEIHAEDELEPALAIEADVLGINNRNLRSDKLITDLWTTATIVPRVPPRLTLISESGIRSRKDVQRLAALGIDGILVGEHLMREPDPGAAIADKLGLGGARHS